MFTVDLERLDEIDKGLGMQLEWIVIMRSVQEDWHQANIKHL
jgi:hypothetical protein